MQWYHPRLQKPVTRRAKKKESATIENRVRATLELCLSSGVSAELPKRERKQQSRSFFLNVSWAPTLGQVLKESHSQCLFVCEWLSVSFDLISILTWGHFLIFGTDTHKGTHSSCRIMFKELLLVSWKERVGIVYEIRGQTLKRLSFFSAFVLRWENFHLSKVISNTVFLIQILMCLFEGIRFSKSSNYVTIIFHYWSVSWLFFHIFEQLSSPWNIPDMPITNPGKCFGLDGNNFTVIWNRENPHICEKDLWYFMLDFIFFRIRTNHFRIRH